MICMAIQMKRLKGLRLKKKISQIELGDPAHISRIESGYITCPSLAIVQRIAKKLTMKTWELIKHCEVDDE